MAKSKTETQSKNALVRLVTSLVPGQHNTLPISIPVLQALDGDFEAAAILSQCCYWSERTDASDGYFYKSYEEWEDETTIKETRCRKRVKHLENLGLIQTTVRHVYNVPTLHYRVLHEELTQFLIDSREKVEQAQRDRETKKEEVLKRKRDKKNAENPCYDSIPSNQPDVDLQNERISTSISKGCIPSFQPDLIQRLQSETTTEITSEITNIDSVSGEHADTGESNFKNGLANDGEEAGSNGSVSGKNQQDKGRRETHETQNETVAPPKKKWNPSIPIGFDSSGYIKLPPLKDVDPKYKATYSAVWPKVYRETQFHVVEEWIDSDRISIDEGEDGEIIICDINGDWTEEEAFGQGGCLPLRLLRDVAAADPDSGFSVDEYNEFIIDRFNYHWNRV